jgi:hypothetical protein
MNRSPALFNANHGHRPPTVFPKARARVSTVFLDNPDTVPASATRVKSKPFSRPGQLPSTAVQTLYYWDMGSINDTPADYLDLGSVVPKTTDVMNFGSVS